MLKKIQLSSRYKRVSVLLLDYTGSKRRALQNLMFFVTAHNPTPPPPPNEERGRESYPRPTADPPQCHSNSWHIRSPAGVFVSFSLQPEQETSPKVQIGHILLRAEFKGDRQTSKPATLPEPERDRGGGDTATFYFPKKSQNTL